MSDNKTESLTDELLTFLYLCEDQKHPIAVPLKNMDGAIPTMGDTRSDGLTEFLIPHNDGDPAVWPVDVKTIIRTEDSGIPLWDQWPRGSLQFHRTRTIRAAEARKYGASRFSRLMLIDEMAVAMPDGSTQSGGGPYCFLGARWVPAAPAVIRYPPERDTAIKMALGWALALRYEWTVWIGYSSGPRVRFLSDPIGAREAFRLRDIPQGRTRRLALRHWVTAHWRQKRVCPEDRIWVRKHLRGAVDFTWNDLRCRIQPPEFDESSDRNECPP